MKEVYLYNEETGEEVIPDTAIVEIGCDVARFGSKYCSAA